MGKKYHGKISKFSNSVQLHNWEQKRVLHTRPIYLLKDKAMKHVLMLLDISGKKKSFSVQHLEAYKHL